LDVWVQLQKLTNYHVKQQADGTVGGRKTGTAPKAILEAAGLRREGKIYAAVLGGQLPEGVLAEGRGSKVIQTEPEKEESLLGAGNHPEGRGVTVSNRPTGSIMGNSLKQTLDEAKNLDELKTFLRNFKEEAERWLGLLELGCGNGKMGLSGLEVGGHRNKAHGDHFKSKDPVITNRRDGEFTSVYSRHSPSKVTTQWQQVSRQPLPSTPQLDRAVLTEKAGCSPGVKKDKLAGRVLLAGLCSTSLPEMCIETEHASRQSLALKLQSDRVAWIESEVLAPGKVGLDEELVTGSSSPAGQETYTVIGSELEAERKETDCVVEEPSCEGDTSTGPVAENGGSGLLSKGTGEEMSRVDVEKILGELGSREGTAEEPEGEKDSIYPNISDMVF